MNIKDHITLLLNKYNLNGLYNKYKLAAIILIICKESFKWLLLYFSHIIKKYTNYIYTFASILICLLIINIPLEKIFYDIKNNLINELKIANTTFYNEILQKINKKTLLTLDLVEYYNIIEHFNENIEQYISNIKIKYDIPFRIVTLIIISIIKNSYLIIILFIVFFIIIKKLNDNKHKSETDITIKRFQANELLRNYIITNKNLFINNEINNNYLHNIIIKYNNLLKDINSLNNNLEFKTNICIFIYILTIIKSRFKNINYLDFYYYFIIIYDIEYVTDKLIEYYKNNYIITRMNIRYNYLNKLYSNAINNITQYNNTPVNQSKPITKIIIYKIYNTNPKLINNQKIIINKNDHILVSGKSGSGKTSILYMLKGIIYIDILDIYPSIEIINKQSFIFLSNHKQLYNDYLYNIITNYDSNPNIELINYSIKYAKFNNNNNNNYINIENLSSGERIRLNIAKIIYLIKTTNYNILLFDEIDENLNDELAYEIYQNINFIFSDKIIFYITHNNKVKSAFNKIIYINNNTINYYEK